jgi:RHS repeat-associated protein
VIPHKKQLFRGRRRIVKSWHRYYDPTTGRYISADPIGLEYFIGGDKKINLYGYERRGSQKKGTERFFPLPANEKFTGTPGVTADWHIPHATTKAAEKKISAAFLIPSRPL